MRDATPERFMRRALVLARRGCGHVEPNPMVGAVMVRQGVVVAEGYHRRFGAKHAEIDLLQQCRQKGVDPAGCDLFVTLEPCSHHGKTPPCADALIEAGIGRVFAALVDPNPAVAGAGIDRLRKAGIGVQVGLCGQQAQQINEPYMKVVASKRPWVIAKWAQTLDGRIATRTGHSQWISNAHSRRWVHQLRARVDAIVVGIGTVLIDDPRLTARGVKLRRVARRVVVDPQGRLPVSTRLFDGQQRAPVTVAVGEELIAARPDHLKALVSRGVELIGLPPVVAGGPTLALDALFEHLVDQHAATNVLVEGGSRLLGALWRQRLVDQVLAFVAPKLLADPDALPAVGGMAPDRIDQATSLALRAVKRFGDDMMLDYRVVDMQPRA